MDLLTNPIKDYGWGSRTAIAALTGRTATGPEAEMWLGAHPSGPSRLTRDGVEHALDEVIAADPAGELGPEVVERFGERLPYLMKLIAVDAALSMQVHPTLDQAADGFARGDRNYSDPWPKPEMIVALTPFSALAGFRPGPEAAALVAALELPALQPVADRLAAGDVLGALRVLLEWPADERPALVADVVRASRHPLVATLAETYPADPAVLAPLLMRHHELAPGQAIYLGAGVLHAYLSGFGVEIMGSSDNVLRAGLTPKPIDIDELLRITDPDEQPAEITPVGDLYLPHCPEFQLRRFVPGEGRTLPGGVPRIAVCVEGTVVLAGETKLRPGDSAFHAASAGTFEVSGQGVVFVAEPRQS
ncbi:mannose-6-phosphate isomerase, class I [Herbidospora sp. NBRC 101105]|uniref:mannose-6-phosphate isomerase, class I n=1 Tax=Herbidospora sp. NBRC 101105 TaxID=3032195 RepID=UPI0024A113FC|nr:mannose-6-phosphate isomerase, class I [Herbidospora sp. NBRC 101105]GLX94956.1 mannose-6-phosphate isomerase, class I [Herbidospora sp. NBRC 101105]